MLNVNFVVYHCIQFVLLIFTFFLQNSFIAAGATRTKDAKELLYARQKVVVVAKAFRLQAIDMVHIDFKGKTDYVRQFRFI